ncbi:hypothetical protein BCR34DRAFT_213287 [Clohesyomyces aquaticus]|uniref:Uncharacterized protein n=1 Tax=Clohesyomyces aquaticus TaxID=1231657 RepID=A0A1Y1ZX32_9PLEO|nr:hypothetical protein BCR34DRAFT_213287 [Clohesyomyces aquaticus]
MLIPFEWPECLRQNAFTCELTCTGTSHTSVLSVWHLTSAIRRWSSGMLAEIVTRRSGAIEIISPIGADDTCNPRLPISRLIVGNDSPQFLTQPLASSHPGYTSTFLGPTQ